LNRENAGGEQVDTSNAVTLEQLEQQTQLIPMMKDSETQLEEWILQVMDEEIALYHAKVAEMCSSGKCVTPIEAAQLVQASLTTFAHDGVNMVDHAQGAKIVYELTSDTYIPPTDESHERLGSVWWRRYIPQDWERVLPSQWEEWKASIPSFLWHSFGQSSAETVPPEAILTANTLPGSCWAMNGSKGQVTIRLSYPVHVKAVTVDHTSALLADVQSAPRTMRIIAYPPCNNSDCNDGIGFDTTKAWDLTTIDYSIEEGETIQTFEISAPAASCAQEAPSCEANPDPLGSMYVSPQKDSFAAAITVAIENNWGKNDYTCLYRFRIHGDAAPEAT
jgi:SUN domain-containing protein 1/2